jgi:hypothetical protein
MRTSERHFSFPRRQARQVVSGSGPANLQVVLIQDLFAAVNTKKDPSKAWARVLTKKFNGKLKMCCRKVLVVNRFKNISIDAGTYIKIEWIGGEYQPYAADCAGDSVSEDSDCSQESV